MHELFLGNSRDEAVAKLLEKIFNAVLLCQSEEQLKAKPHEKTDQHSEQALLLAMMEMVVNRRTLW